MNNLDYINEILDLKSKKNVLILAHYYVDPAVQEIADFVGDSYYLSKIALSSDKDNILFCGVRFMAESAKLLSPHKTIILPDSTADCPMAHMSSYNEIKEIKNKYNDLAVVCYINSTMEIKSLSDVCVTSSNAFNIISNLKEKNIYFIPDQHLGRYISKEFPDKNFIFGDGYCHVHTNILKDNLIKLSKKIPGAKIVSHPECTQDILDNSDFIGSTSAIIDYVSNSTCPEFIVCTEKGILHTLEKQNPDKKFYFVDDNQICPDMKKITLEKVYNSLINFDEDIKLDNALSSKARKSLELMHNLANL